jgi:hypothetical protein
MVKFITVLTLSLLLMGGMATAAIYKCTDAQGTVIYADELSELPPDCKTDQTVDLPQLNVVPAQEPTAATQTGENAPAPSPATSTQEQYAGGAYASLNGEAESLVAEYAAARKRATFAPLFKDKEAAKGKLAELLRQRDRLVNEVEKSPLRPAQKNEILGKLSSMVE